MGTCVKARAALVSLPGIIRVHPYGQNGKVILYLANKEAFDREAFAAALETKQLRLRKAKVAGV